MPTTDQPAEPARPCGIGLLGHLHLPCDPACAKEARDWACLTAAGRVDEDDLRLCVGELVANVCEHTVSAWIDVLIRFDTVLHVEVIDDGSGTWDGDRCDREGGRGLDLVEALTSAWGVIHEEQHTSVWFTMKPVVRL